MAGSDERGLLSNRQVKYPGSPEWNAAFPNGVTWSPSPLPEGTDLGKGFIPASSGPNTNPNNGGNPMSDPTTGKPYPKSG